MNKRTKCAVLAILAAATLAVSMPAAAAPRGDDPGDGIIHRIIKMIRLVIHATDDGGMITPPIPH